MKKEFLGIISMLCLALGLMLVGFEKRGCLKLDSALYELTEATDYEEFAKTKGLYLKDNRVRVVIELVNPDYILAEEFGEEETGAKELLQALIYIDKLLELAEEPEIKFIRLPHTAVALSYPSRLSFKGRQACFELRLGQRVNIVEGNIGTKEIKLLSIDIDSVMVSVTGGYYKDWRRSLAVDGHISFVMGGKEQMGALELLEIEDNLAKFKIRFGSAPPAPEIPADMPIDIIYLD